MKPTPKGYERQSPGDSPAFLIVIVIVVGLAILGYSAFMR